MWGAKCPQFQYKPKSTWVNKTSIDLWRHIYLSICNQFKSICQEWRIYFLPRLTLLTIFSAHHLFHTWLGTLLPSKFHWPPSLKEYEGLLFALLSFQYKARAELYMKCVWCPCLRLPSTSMKAVNLDLWLEWLLICPFSVITNQPLVSLFVVTFNC